MFQMRDVRFKSFKPLKYFICHDKDFARTQLRSRGDEFTSAVLSLRKIHSLFPIFLIEICSDFFVCFIYFAVKLLSLDEFAF
jgi:hypothetical protein